MHKKIDRAKVRDLNKLIYARSGDYVIARDLALIERLKK